MVGLKALGTRGTWHSFWFILGECRQGQVPRDAKVLPPICKVGSSVTVPPAPVPNPGAKVHFKFETFQILERQQGGICILGDVPNGSGAGFPNLGTMAGGGRCPVHCRMLSSFHGLYLPMPVAILFPQW